MSSDPGGLCGKDTRELVTHGAPHKEEVMTIWLTPALTLWPLELWEVRSHLNHSVYDPLQLS
jgi:hypothetical protein